MRAMGSVRSGRSVRRLPSTSKSWNGKPLMRPARSSASRDSKSGVSTGRYPCDEKTSRTVPEMRSRASAS